jgi:hypothetical protein
MKGGGHSQEALAEMDRMGLNCSILHTYPKGVRIGNVPKHLKDEKRQGTRMLM